MEKARSFLRGAEERNGGRDDNGATGNAVAPTKFKRGRKTNPAPLRDPDAALDFQADVA